MGVALERKKKKKEERKKVWYMRLNLSFFFFFLSLFRIILRQCQILNHWARPGIEPITSWFLVGLFLLCHNRNSFFFLPNVMYLHYFPFKLGRFGWFLPSLLQVGKATGFYKTELNRKAPHFSKWIHQKRAPRSSNLGKADWTYLKRLP